MLAPIITNNHSKINDLCKTHFVKELYVFGSAATNQMKDESDIDFIVKFNSEVKIEDYADLYFDLADSLENLLKRNIDLMTAKPINNSVLRDSIEKTKQIIYVAA
jgi:predicted nucleotidyltransferase